MSWSNILRIRRVPVAQKELRLSSIAHLMAPLILAAAAAVSFAQSVAAANLSPVELPCSQYVQEPSASYFTSQIDGKQLTLQIENHNALLVLPKAVPLSAPKQWVWFAPMVHGVPGERHLFILQHVLAAGMAFATIDVGESYGSPAGTRLYAEFHDVLQCCFNLAAKAVLFPQSRGGLMLLNWAVLHPDEVERIAGIYPVSDLRTYPGLKTASNA